MCMAGIPAITGLSGNKLAEPSNLEFSLMFFAAFGPVDFVGGVKRAMVVSTPVVHRLAPATFGKLVCRAGLLGLAHSRVVKSD
jgi:hypothetical protein